MSHLSTERLAALGDEEPTAAEAAHLASCATCARERAAYRALLAMAHSERDAVGIPLTRWESIAGALSAEARVAPVAAASRATGRPTGSRAIHFMRLPLRAAAGILLVAGGVVAGRLSARPSALPGLADGAGTSAGVPAAQLPDSMSFESVEAARAVQLRSEVLYQQAAAFLAQNDTASTGYENPDAVKSRLAALDQMISTTRAAMREVPHDPVINGYYLTTVGQREATLRQLNTVLPATLRSNSF